MAEGAAWVRRGEFELEGGDGGGGGGEGEGGGGLHADALLQAARYAIYSQSAHTHDNLSLHVHTTQVR